MRILFLAGLACVAGALASCGIGRNSGSEVKDIPTSDGVTQVNPRAFNAFNIWRDGQSYELLDYPRGYDVLGWHITPDGVFYFQSAVYWKDNKFIGVPTAGAKVVKDVLEYPSKNGKQLKLKFTKIAEKKMSHLDAVTFCKDQGLRLPTVRELFDFCAAGVTEPNYGPNFVDERYPSTGRCRRLRTWSASVHSFDRVGAWGFIGFGGYVLSMLRDVPSVVRCVGPEQ